MGWYDAAIQWGSISTQCVGMMATLWHDEPMASSMGGFLLRNHRMYDVVVDGITRAKQSLYMEQQYFFSDDGKVHNNKIADTIVARISRAFQANQPFHVTLLTNRWFPHEPNKFIRGVVSSLQHDALQSLLSRVVTIVGSTALPMYLTIMVPTDRTTTIHTKLYMFDQDRILLTSGNIMDTCFDDAGHGEFSWICESDPEVCTKLRSAILQSSQQLSVSNVLQTDAEPFPIASSIRRRFLGPASSSISQYLLQLCHVNMSV
jgi:hypothetical protein